MPRSRIWPEQRFVLTLPQFAPAMAWLDFHDIPRSVIAALFHVTEPHVSVLVHRAKCRARRNDAPLQIESVSFQTVVNRPPTFEESEPVRIRRQALNPDEIRTRMEYIVRRNSQAYTFLRGVAELDKLRPHLGDPKNEVLLRLLAQLHCHKAWFFTHAGWSRSSIEAANEAYLSALELYRRTRAHDELQIIADAALIASNSHLNRFEPVEARRALRLAAAVRETQSAYLNEEYYRQLAVTNLQAENDTDARRWFKKAFRVMREQGHSDNDVSVLLSTRQANLLPPVNWDGKRGALEILDSVRRHFPEHSNEFNIAVSWTAACGFSIDSPAANLQAQELIEHHCPYASRFGHRATVVALLRLVPQLPPALRADFVRFAVHQNAFAER
jgi:hypothetical protein